MDDILVGEDFTVRIAIRNNATEVRTIETDLTVKSVDVTGRALKMLAQTSWENKQLQPGEGKY